MLYLSITHFENIAPKFVDNAYT